MIDELLMGLKDRRMVVLAAPLVMGILLGAPMVVQPGLRKISAAKTARQDIDKKESVFNSILSWEQKIDEYKDRFVKIGDKGQSISRLNALAGESGLTVLSITPEEKRSVGTYFESMAVRIEADGNYHQLGDFVSRVESLPQLVKISALEIDTDTNEGAAGAGSSALSPMGMAASTPSQPRRPGARSYKISIGVSFYSQKASA